MTDSGDESALKLLSRLPEAARDALIGRYAEQAGLSVPEMKARLLADWRIVGRPKQQPPGGDWTYWMILAGRGFGKTLTGAQWVKQVATAEQCRVALVAPTLMDVRQTMVEGESGLLSIIPPEHLRGGERSTAWNRSTVELYLANGSHIRGFTSEVPDRLRGWQQHYAWGDEVSSWNDARLGDKLDTTYNNLKLSTRLGDHPRFCFTTTPRANKLTKEILAIKPPSLAIARGSSYENRDNLAEAWWQEVVAPMEGTRTGKQEIMAMVLEDVEGALWTMRQLDDLRLRDAPELARIVVGVDPNVSSDEAANAAGIVVAGADAAPGNKRRGYVLADCTVAGGPSAWAQAAVAAFHKWGADRIVAEKNQGGEMVELTLHTVDPNVPIKLVSASRGKRTRAEPIAAMYEGSDTVPPRVFHVGLFAELEEEMTTWTPTPGADSPDRMDALVWALTELLLGPSGTMTSHVPKGRIPRLGERLAYSELMGQPPPHPSRRVA